MRRAPGIRRRTIGERGQQHVLVRWPGRAGHERRGAGAVAEQRVVAPDGRDPRRDAVEAGIAEHADPFARHAEPGEPVRVVLGDRAGGGHGRVARAEQRPGRPAQPATAGAHGGGHHGDRRARAVAARVASSGQRSSLANTRRSGVSAASSASVSERTIVGQVVGGVHVQPPRQRLGGRAEVGVDQLSTRARGAGTRAARSRPAALRRPRRRGTRPADVAGRDGRRPTRPDAAPRRGGPGGRRRPCGPAGRWQGRAPRRVGRRHGSPRRSPASGQCRGGMAGRQSDRPPGRRSRGACMAAGRYSRIRARSSCSTCYRGGDPLSTESRVACGC